ncbi:MAG: stringent starvation protein B [Leptospira sp.]|nr:stringent starvation protein B [Leptospira sp.]
MEEKITPEELKCLREFKASVFDVFWEKFGTFYIHIMPHQSLEIGKRGLVGEEKESGIILILGPRAVRDVSSQPEYLYAELQFGYTWEKLFIPWDAVFRMYDKNQSSVVQMRIFNEPVDFDEPGNKAKKKTITKKMDGESNVIQVDFGTKK